MGDVLLKVVRDENGNVNLLQYFGKQLILSEPQTRRLINLLERQEEGEIREEAGL